MILQVATYPSLRGVGRCWGGKVITWPPDDWRGNEAGIAGWLLAEARRCVDSGGLLCADWVGDRVLVGGGVEGYRQAFVAKRKASSDIRSTAATLIHRHKRSADGVISHHMFAPLATSDRYSDHLKTSR